MAPAIDDDVTFANAHDCREGEQTVGPVSDASGQTSYVSPRMCVATVTGRYDVELRADHGVAWLTPEKCTELPPDAVDAATKVPVGASMELAFGTCERVAVSFESDDPSRTEYEIVLTRLE